MDRLVFGFTLFACLALSTPAFCGQHLGTVEWDTYLYTGDGYVNRLKLDIGFGGRYYSANGVIEYFDGSSSPCTGSGFESAGGGFFFSLDCVGSNVILDLNTSINGNIQIFNAVDTYLDSSFLTFRKLY